MRKKQGLNVLGGVEPVAGDQCRTQHCGAGMVVLMKACAACYIALPRIYRFIEQLPLLLILKNYNVDINMYIL